MLPFVIKVCGVTTVEDAQAALDAGANALGFNFYLKSPRYLSVDKALDIIRALRGDFSRVGVFVQPNSETLDSAASFLDVAQIHGAVPASVPLPLWRAINPGSDYQYHPGVDAWLLDSISPGFGGSGQTFDWALAAAFPHRAILAGGLDGTNVAEAIRVGRPWGVDSCSRLESTPGRKDQTKVAAFVKAALTAFHAQQAVNI